MIKAKPKTVVPFQKGDTIKCIRNEGFTGKIMLDREYEVLSVDSDGFPEIKTGNRYNFFFDKIRFEFVGEPSKRKKLEDIYVKKITSTEEDKKYLTFIIDYKRGERQCTDDMWTTASRLLSNYAEHSKPFRDLLADGFQPVNKTSVNPGIVNIVTERIKEGMSTVSIIYSYKIEFIKQEKLTTKITK